MYAFEPFLLIHEILLRCKCEKSIIIMLLQSIRIKFCAQYEHDVLYRCRNLCYTLRLSANKLQMLFINWKIYNFQLLDVVNGIMPKMR